MSKQSLIETDNKQVMADTFCNLVRYALRKIKRDADLLGVNSNTFSVASIDDSLTDSGNSATSSGEKLLTITALLKKTRHSSLTFQFYWKAVQSTSPLIATFELSREAGDLKVRLLWLALPEKYPISPKVGIIDGRQPLEEAITELLVIKRGHILAYPPPT